MKKYIYIFGIALAATLATSCSVEYALLPTVEVEHRVVRTRHHHTPAPPPPPAPYTGPHYGIPGVPHNNTTVIIAETHPNPGPGKPAPEKRPRVEPAPAPHNTATPAKPTGAPKATGGARTAAPARSTNAASAVTGRGR